MLLSSNERSDLDLNNHLSKRTRLEQSERRPHETNTHCYLFSTAGLFKNF